MELENHIARSNTAPRLRLVSALSAPALAPRVIARYSLRSRLLGTDADLRPSALVDLIDGLLADEGVDIVHVVDRPGIAPGTYRLHVDVVQRLPARPDELRTATGQALAASLPHLDFAFDPDPAFVETPPLRAVIAPAPAQLARPVRGGLWEALDQRVPYPASMPNWPLTRPIEEPIATHLVVRIRIRGYALPDRQRSRFLGLANELRQGVLKVRHPDAPMDQGGHDSDLVEPTARLLKHWLTRPQGYAIDIVVHCPEPLSGFAIQRIARDVLGEHQPWVILPVDDVPATVGGEQPVPLLCTQGLPGLFPSVRVLIACAVPARQLLHSPLPQGPGVVIGHVGDDEPLVLPDAWRASHVAVIGASGSGKSSFLMRLLQSDIERGHGVGLIDPHGDLFDRVLELIPTRRASDVVVVDVEDPEHSVAINPMDGTQGNVGLQHYIASEICEIIDRLFENTNSSGPVTRNHVRHALLLAMQHREGGTLRDAARVFEDPDYRSWLLSVATPELKAYFQGFERTDGENGFRNWLPYLLARLQPFATNPAMLRLLSRPSTVNLGRLMDEGRIVLFKLSKSVLQDTECQLLGTVLLKAFHTAALARAARSPAERRPFHLVVDEFHTFATDAAPGLFREARKYGLGLTVATQTWSSLRGSSERSELPNAMLASTATKVLFRLSARDGALLEEYSMPQFSAANLARIPNYQAVICQSATDSPPCLARMAQAEPEPDAIDALELRRRSGAVFGTPLQQANEYLAHRHRIPVESLLGRGLWSSVSA